MKKYRRQAFYDYDKKQWKTFYYNDVGELKFDKQKKEKKYDQYRDVLKTISKNKYPVLSDFINKKQSIIKSNEIQNVIEGQKRIKDLIDVENLSDRKLKKYIKAGFVNEKNKLSKTGKKTLLELSKSTGYLKKEIKKKIRIKEEKEEIKEYFEMNVPGTYFFYSKYRGFYIPRLTFYGGEQKLKSGKIKKIISLRDQAVKTFEKYSPDRLKIIIDGYEGEIDYSSLETLESFENDVSDSIRKNGNIEYVRGNLINIKMYLIKR